MDGGITVGERAIGRLWQIPMGEGRNFDVDGTRIAVFHTQSGEVFATQADCPHRGGPLADGLIGGRTLVCPLHDHAFDLSDGSSLTNACVIKTYAVRVAEDGRLLLQVTAAPTKLKMAPTASR